MEEQQQEQATEQPQPAQEIEERAAALPEVSKSTADLMAYGQSGFEPKNFAEVWRLASTLARSELVPKDYRGKPANIVLAMQMSKDLGVPFMQGIQNIASINGRTSVWGDLVRALIESSGLLEDIDEFFEGEFPEDDFKAVCIVTRVGRKPYRREFSVADAKTAGLWGQNTHKTYPKDMLINRAFSRCAKGRFADVLKGVAIREDLDGPEVIDVTPTPTEAPSIVVAQQDLKQRLEAAKGKPAAAVEVVEPETIEVKPEPKPAPAETKATPRPPKKVALQDQGGLYD